MSDLHVKFVTRGEDGWKRPLGVDALDVWQMIGILIDHIRKQPDGGRAAFENIYEYVHKYVRGRGRASFLELSRQLAGGNRVYDEAGVLDQSEVENEVEDEQSEPVNAAPPPPAPEPEMTEFERSARKSVGRKERVENAVIMFARHITPLLEKMRLLKGAYPKVMPYEYATLMENGVEVHYVLLVTVVREVYGRTFELKCIIDEDGGPSIRNGLTGADGKVVRYANAKNEPDPITGDSLWISPTKIEEHRLIRFYGKFLDDSRNDDDYDCRYVVRSNKLVRVTNVDEYLALVAYRKMMVHGIPKKL